MTSYYDEIELDDLDFDSINQEYTYPCPCGDVFRIGLEELLDGEDVAGCASCTLRIKIIYEEEELPEWRDEDDDRDWQGVQESDTGGSIVDVVASEVKGMKLSSMSSSSLSQSPPVAATPEASIATRAPALPSHISKISKLMTQTIVLL